MLVTAMAASCRNGIYSKKDGMFTRATGDDKKSTGSFFSGEVCEWKVVEVPLEGAVRCGNG
jgi:hypothetical protein